jgi:hypothetical protein
LVNGGRCRRLRRATGDQNRGERDGNEFTFHRIELI